MTKEKHMTNLASLIQSNYKAIVKVSGRVPDTIVVGTDQRANQALEALMELGLDMHVIADDELGRNSLWLCSSEDLAKFPGGGRN
jgi:DNA-binding LacI/PurR family transcriptional regulator